MYTTLLAFSISLQFIAAGIALSYIGRTRELYAWILLSLVIILMAVRRCITFVNVLLGNSVVEPAAEITALIISVLTILTVVLLGRMFGKLSSLQNKLQSKLQEKVEVENALKDSQERYRLAENSVNEGIWDWNLETEEVYLSDRWLKLLGYSQEEMKRADERFYDLIYPLDLERFKDALRAHFKDKTSFDLEFKVRHKDGGYRWFQIKGDGIRNDANRVVRMVGSIADTTDKKHAECITDIERKVLHRMAEGDAFCEVMQDVVSALESEADGLMASITYLDGEEPVQVCSHGIPESCAQFIYDRQVLKFHKEGVRYESYEIDLDHISTDSDFFKIRAEAISHNIGAVMSVPVTHATGEVLAFMDIFAPTKAHWSWLSDLIQQLAHLTYLFISRHRDEQSLNEVQKRFQGVFEQAAVGVALVKAETGMFVQVNERLSSMVGYDPGDLENMTITDLMFKNPYDQGATEVLLLAYSENDEINTELQLVNKDGSRIWVEINASPLRKSDNLHESTYILVVQDITERKRVEQNIRFHSEILDNMEECLFIVKCEDQKIVYVNSQFNGMFGYDKEEAIGMHFSKLLASVEQSAEQTAERIVAKLNENSSYRGEIQSAKKDGTVFWRKANISTYEHPEHGKSWISINEDVTFIKEVEDSVHKMEKLKSVGVLAGGLAHDFNNILLGVFTNISLVREKLDKRHEGHKFLQDALGAMQRAQSLTNQLLTFAKGGYPMKEGASIDKIVEDVVRFDLTGSQVKPIFRKVNGLWLTEIDKGQIQQVFSNLSINAKEAMGGVGNLYITMENCETGNGTPSGFRPGNYVKISIRDTGPGIEPHHRNQIFDPYFSTKEKGSGLGLATTYSIINRHGGYIGVDSTMGEGTTFTIYIPATGKSERIKWDKLDVGTELIGAGANILIMDDEEMILKAVGQLLKERGYKVSLANDGKEAIDLYHLAMLENVEYDLVILDITVPGGVGGKEAVKEILDINRDAIVIASSGYADDPAMSKYTDHGFAGVITKPYTVDELLHTVHQALAGNALAKN